MRRQFSVFFRNHLSCSNQLTRVTLRQPQLHFRSISHFAHVKAQPLDAIKQLTIEFNNDTSSNKVLLGEGVYRTDEGLPNILQSVRSAEECVFQANLDHEYAPVSGIPEYCRLARRFAFGDDSVREPANNPVDVRTASVQAVSGTGALRVAAAFLRRFYGEQSSMNVYVPKPTWMNHNKIFSDEGFNIKHYRYYDAKTNGMDVSGCLEDIRNAPEGSIVLFHACAHNPTGVDPTMDTWKELSQICKERNHMVFFDSAYQAFASGDADIDAQSFRTFVKDGHTPIITQSFSKNFGLYGERTGAIHIVCDNPDQAKNITSQLMVIIRSMYSNPPIYGARLVSTVLGDAELTKQWRADVTAMADRIKEMRTSLVQLLQKYGSKRNWDHITNQIGMFAYSGLNEQEVERLKQEFHIYMTKDGRLSVSGLNSSNIDYVAKSIVKVAG